MQVDFILKKVYNWLMKRRHCGGRLFILEFDMSSVAVKQEASSWMKPQEFDEYGENKAEQLLVHADGVYKYLLWKKEYLEVEVQKLRDRLLEKYNERVEFRIEELEFQIECMDRCIESMNVGKFVGELV